MRVEVLGLYLGDAEQSELDNWETAYEFYRSVDLNETGKLLLKTTLDWVPVLIIKYGTGEFTYVNDETDEETSGRLVFEHVRTDIDE